MPSAAKALPDPFLSSERLGEQSKRGSRFSK